MDVRKIIKIGDTCFYSVQIFLIKNQGDENATLK